jgi:hypothetical protein
MTKRFCDICEQEIKCTGDLATITEPTIVRYAKKIELSITIDAIDDITEVDVHRDCLWACVNHTYQESQRGTLVAKL